MRPLASRLSLHAAAVCAAALVAAAPRRADAQFGRLRDAAGAATRAAAERGGERAAGDAAARQGGGARASAVAFTDEVLEITDARLDQLVRGLDAERAARPAAERRQAARVAAAQEAERTYPARRAAYEREHAAWTRRKAEHDACVDRAEARHAGAAAGLQAEAEAQGAAAKAHFSGDREARMKALAERARAAQARGDQAALMALADSAQRIMRNDILPVANASMALATRAQAVAGATAKDAGACGVLAAEPQAPAGAGGADPDGAAAEIRKAGREASGLSDRQYEVLRERAEEYVRRGGRTGGSMYRYGAGELGALGRRLGALKAHPALTADPSWTAGEGAGA
jgi:hypothetical protein